MNDTWVQRFFDRAEAISRWSKDPSTKIGAVFVDPINKIELSSGYNGFPRGIADTDYRYNDRDTKLKYVAHAEMNGIYNACRMGRSLENSILFIHGLPACSECAKGIIQVGVKEIYVLQSAYDKAGRWKESAILSGNMFLEAGIKLHVINDLEGIYE